VLPSALMGAFTGRVHGSTIDLDAIPMRRSRGSGYASSSSSSTRTFA